MDDPESLITRLQSLIDAATGKLIDNLSPAQISEYHEVMEELLSRYHLAAYMVGAGTQTVTGLARERVLNGIAGQLAYLDVFIDEIRDADTGEMGWMPRARMYGESIGEAYWAGKTKGLPLPSLPKDGTTQCLTNCSCKWEIKTIDEGKRNYDAYWRRGAQDSCQTCIERENTWNPIRIRNGVLLSE